MTLYFAAAFNLHKIPDPTDPSSTILVGGEFSNSASALTWTGSAVVFGSSSSVRIGGYPAPHTLVGELWSFPNPNRPTDRVKLGAVGHSVTRVLGLAWTGTDLIVLGRVESENKVKIVTIPDLTDLTTAVDRGFLPSTDTDDTNFGIGRGCAWDSDNGKLYALSSTNLWDVGDGTSPSTATSVDAPLLVARGGDSLSYAGQTTGEPPYAKFYSTIGTNLGTDRLVSFDLGRRPPQLTILGSLPGGHGVQGLTNIELPERSVIVTAKVGGTTASVAVQRGTPNVLVFVPITADVGGTTAAVAVQTNTPKVPVSVSITADLGGTTASVFALKDPTASAKIVDILEIDWNDDGYLSSDADVTPNLYSYIINYGMELGVDSSDFVNRPARGTIRLSNQSRQYSYESITAFDSLALVRPHKARLRTSTFGIQAVLWEGIARPPRIEERSGASFADIDLEGKLYHAYAQSYERVEEGILPAQTVIDQLATTLETSRSVVTNLPTQNISAILFDGSIAEYMSQLSRVIGGYVFEDHLGNIAAISHAQAVSAGYNFTIDADEAWILSDSPRLIPQIGLVRNKANFRSKELRYGTARAVATIFGSLDGLGGAVREIRVFDATVLKVEWPTLTELQALLPTGIQINENPNGDTFFDRHLIIRLQNLTGTAIPFNVDIVARPLQDVSTTVFASSYPESIARYSEQEMKIEAWFAGDTDRAIGNQYLEIRSTPLNVGGLIFPRQQPTELQSARVHSMIPGRIVLADIPGSDGTPVQAKLLILGVQLYKNFDSSAFLSASVVEVDSVGSAGSQWDAGSWGTAVWDGLPPP